MINTIIYNLIHSGIPKNADYQLLTGSRLLNISSLFLAITYTLPALILAPIINDFYFISMGIAMGVGFILPFFFHRLGLLLLSKVTYVCYLNIVIFIVSSSLGEAYHIQTIFILHVGISFILFSPQQRLLRILALTIPILLFLFLEYTDYELFPKINLTPKLRFIIYYLAWLIIGVFFVLTVFNSLVVQEKLTKELLGKHTDLLKSEEYLKTREEKLKFFANNLDEIWKNFQKIDTFHQKGSLNLDSKAKFHNSEEKKLEAAINKLQAIQQQMKISYTEQQQFVAMVENSFDFIALADFKGALVYMNEEGKKIVGLGKDKNIQELKIVDLMQQETGEMLYRKIIPEVVTKGFWKGELDLKNIKTGEIIYTDVSTFIIRDKETQEPLAWATIQKDITKRKKTEAALATIHENLKEVLNRERKSKEDLLKIHEALKKTQSKLVFSEKMASLGHLTAGIAHEINNPMNFVYAGGEALKENLEELLQIVNLYATLDDEREVSKKLIEIKELKDQFEYPTLIQDIRNLLDDVRVGAERTIGIVEGLKLFSHADDERMKLSDIHLALDTTIMMLSGLIKDDVTIVKNYDNNLPKIDCFTGQISQVFMNIIGNALDAVADKKKGFVEITTKDFADKITISINDNGEGMSQEVKKRIFEPFFTTKEIGKGTGLGMSISYGIIEKHHGSIAIKSQKGEGAELIITLPKGK